MQQEKLTIKSQEALHAAQRQAEKMHHTEVDVEHLLLALAEQEDGVVPPLLEKLGVPRAALQQQLEQILAKRATVEGGSAERYLSSSLRKALDAALTLAEKMKDEYVSTEHLLLAILQAKGSDAARIAQQLG